MIDLIEGIFSAQSSASESAILQSLYHAYMWAIGIVRVKLLDATLPAAFLFELAFFGLQKLALDQKRSRKEETNEYYSYYWSGLVHKLII